MTDARSRAAELHDRGVALYQRGEYGRAESKFRAALEIDPTRDISLSALGSSLLAQGRYREGFQLFDHRRKLKGLFKGAPGLPLPRWRGEDPAGKRILVFHEEGFGDQIMYARYAAALIRAGARVEWICQPPLTRLLSECLGVVTHRNDAPVVMSDVDFYSPSSALPLGFGDHLPPAPFLSRPPPNAPAGSRIGVLGRGKPSTPNDENRSLPGKDEARLLSIPGAISLRPEDTGATDFYDTAAIMAGLDLVITVDASPAHLAGALGIPVWVLVPATGKDWRWQRSGDRSPWYPSATLWRQAHGEPWSAVVDRVLKDARGRYRPV